MVDIGGYGSMVMKGGSGLKHFSHLILKLSLRESDWEGYSVGMVRLKIKTGFYIEAKVEKTKISGFQDQASYPLL
jgi:hypothetical protein